MPIKGRTTSTSVQNFDFCLFIQCSISFKFQSFTHSSPILQTKKQKHHEQKQALSSCDGCTSHIRWHVSALKSCIRPWHEQFHLCILQTGRSHHFPNPFCF